MHAGVPITRNDLGKRSAARLHVHRASADDATASAARATSSGVGRTAGRTLCNDRRRCGRPPSATARSPSRSIPTPSRRPGELLVRVRAAGLNGADMLQLAGHYPPPPGAPADIPGLELAGEVVAVGPRRPSASSWATA